MVSTVVKCALCENEATLRSYVVPPDRGQFPPERGWGMVRVCEDHRAHGAALVANWKRGMSGLGYQYELRPWSQP